MTAQTIVSANRLRVLHNGQTRLDTDIPMPHAVFRTGQVSLPSRQASRTGHGELIVNQTDSYYLANVPNDATLVFGMIKWVTPGNSERLINDGKWTVYGGQVIQATWSSNYTWTGFFADRYEMMTSFCAFFFEVVSGQLWLRDRLYIRAPRNETFTPLTRTRPASTLEYRLYCASVT